MSVRVASTGSVASAASPSRRSSNAHPTSRSSPVNDIVDVPTNALLFKHDSTYGAYAGTVEHTEDAIIVDGHEIKVLQVSDPSQLPWKALGVDIVIESTGRFTDADKARVHLDAGAKKVLISAPAKKEDVTIVLGVKRRGL